MQQYAKGPIIGEGTYGSVIKATHKETGRAVAIKKVRLRSLNRRGCVAAAFAVIPLCMWHLHASRAPTTPTPLITPSPPCPTPTHPPPSPPLRNRVHAGACGQQPGRRPRQRAAGDQGAEGAGVRRLPSRGVAAGRVPQQGRHQPVPRV